MKTSDFAFNLPGHLVAQVPADARDASRLLVYSRAHAAIEDTCFRALPDIIRALRDRTGAREILFVANDSRVYPARVRVRRASGARGEVFLLKRGTQGPWPCLLRPQKKLRVGEILLSDDTGAAAFRVESLDPPLVSVACLGFQVSNEAEALDTLLEAAGEMPLPPYIERDPARLADVPGAHALLDSQRYQTVYAGSASGSAAAPTAGLHFTPDLMRACEAEGARFSYVTLHVGLGTFSPVQSERIENHDMHEEWCVVPSALAQDLEQVQAGTREGTFVVFVGTTSLRTVESYFRSKARPGVWFPTRLFLHPQDNGARVSPAVGDALLTNFHQPESTLVMLVAALLGGNAWRSLYQHAIASNYRFFSYGDASLLLLSERASAALGPHVAPLASGGPKAAAAARSEETDR